MRFRTAFAVVSSSTLVFSLAGCGGDDQGSASATKEVVVDGSSTVFLVSRAAAEAYATVDPSTSVVVNNHGTGGGFGKYIKGEADLTGASRPAKPKEEAEAKAAGMLPWSRFVVGYDGLSIIVNPKNDFAKSMSVAQLKALFEPGSKVQTWKDLDPSWPDRKITLFSADNDSGTFDYFTETIVGKSKAQRPGVQQSSDDNQTVRGVADDVDALGYLGYAYFAANQSKLKLVAIRKDDASEPVLPSPETILDKSYVPLSRPLFIYVKDAAMARPEVAGFVKYYVENAAELAKTAGYVAPASDEIAENKKALASAGAAKPAA